jgi:hypothetical protein
MTYPVEAEDIIDSLPKVKDAIFDVYNQGFIEGMKEGHRRSVSLGIEALKAIDKSFEESK